MTVKKVFCMFLSFFILMSISAPAFASSDSNPVFQEDSVVSEPFVDPDKVGTTYPGITTRDFYGERTVTRGRYTTYKEVKTEPTGQPSMGYVGGSGAFVFFFESGGKSDKFSITVNGKIMTLYAETGRVATSGSGYGALVPKESGRYRFKFVKNYVIKTTVIDVYQGPEYKYTFYRNDPQYSLDHEWIELK